MIAGSPQCISFSWFVGRFSSMLFFWLLLEYHICSVVTGEPYVSGDFKSFAETTTKKPGVMLDPASVALQFVENVRTAASCDGGTSNILNVVFDNSEWKAQANAAVRLSNLLTHWFMTNGSSNAMTDELLFDMTRTTIEIETLAFGSAVAFEPGVYRKMDKFCAYSFHTGNTTIKSHDISVEYDYFPSEWYLGCKEKYLNSTNILKDNVTLRLSEYNVNGTKVHKTPVTFLEPRMEYDDGFWTRPYFDCGGGDIWMITFNSPILAVINGSLTFSGVATVDIALNILDIDQCDATSDAKKMALNVFRGTHRCKPSSICMPRTGLGFRRGTYLCACRPGFYFPNASSTTKAFSGFEIEDAYAAWVVNGSSEYSNEYDCIRCPEGCDTCVDSTPCLAVWNWVVRSVLLAVVAIMVVCVHLIALVVIKHQKRTIIKSASPMFLLIICLGGIIITTSGMLEFSKVTREICTARVWFQHLGFVLIYGPLLLKNWRIAVVFNVSDGKPKAVTDNLVLQKLGMVVTPVAIYLTVWTILSSPKIQMARTAQGLKYYMCQENWMDYGIIVAECVFLVWGVVLSYQIRNVISTFNESKLVAWTIYNTIFMKNFLIIIRTFMIGSIDPDVLYLMYVLELQIPVTCTFAILFGPKIQFLRTACPNTVNPQSANNTMSNFTIRERQASRRSSKDTDDISGAVNGAKNGFVSRIENRS